MAFEPFVAYPMRHETRPLILDIGVGFNFWEHSAIVYPGVRRDGLQRPKVMIKASGGNKATSKVVARLVATPAKYQMVWHLNQYTFDCRLSNLECISNADYASRLYGDGVKRYLETPRQL